VERVLCEAVRGNRESGATGLANCVLNTNDEYECGQDRSVVVIRFLGPPITIVVSDPACVSVEPDLCGAIP